MASVSRSKQKLLAALPLVALAAALYVLGTRPARAPEAALACPVEAAPAGAAAGLDAAQRVLAEFLSRRYQVAGEATAAIVAAAHGAAEAAGLDPLLVLAMIGIESRFNPLAQSSMGAKGLMQIIPKFHRARLAAHGGDEAVLDPESNIVVGTQILREYVHRTGTLEAGLQFYNGAMRDGSAQYAHKVMAERLLLERAMRAGLRQARAATSVEGG
jgi:soluble lytic murein transglycosylase-like protein